MTPERHPEAVRQVSVRYDAARMILDPNGTRVSRSIATNYDAFWAWLTTHVLDTKTTE